MCEVCNDKRIVQVVTDELKRDWPCPKCRIQKYTVAMPFTDHDVLDWLH